MAGPRSVVLLIFCSTLLLSSAAEDKETDGRSAVSDSWHKLKKAIGGLASGAEAGPFGERQAYQDAQRHYARPPQHVMPSANKRRPGFRPNASHPPRPTMLFGGFQPMAASVPMRPRHPMPVPKPAHNQQLNQQRGPHNQQQYAPQQQPQQPQPEHTPNQQASPKIRTVAGRLEQPPAQQPAMQSQHEQYHQPYPIELIDLPPPPVPPPSFAQQELLKLQFTGDEYLTYLYLSPPVIKEPEQDIQVAQSAPGHVTHERHEQRLRAVVSPSVAIYDPYRYNSVHSLMHWEKKDKQSPDEDWIPIHSPWGNESPINGTSNASP